MSDRKQFSLLVVRGDGARVFRLNVPRRLPLYVFLAVLTASLTASAVLTDWWQLRQRMRDSATLFQRIDEQQTTIDAFNRRVADLRREVTGWRDLHDRIWEAFGPEAPARAKVKGMGGRRRRREPVQASLTPGGTSSSASRRW